MVALLTLLYCSTLFLLLVSTLFVSLHQKDVHQSIHTWLRFGFVSNCIILSAYYVTLPLEGVSTIAGFIVITLIVVGISFLLGLPYYSIGYVLYKFRSHTWLRFFAFITSFLLVEIIRPYLFTIITWGGGSTFGAHGSTWALGSILAATPLVSFALYGGVFTLGAVLAYISSVIVFPLTLRTRISLLLILVATWFGIRLMPTEPSLKATVAVIQTAFPHVLEGEDINKTYTERVNETLHQQVLAMARTKPDLIVLPEDLRYLDLLSSKHKKEFINAFPNSLIADGGTRFVNNERKNISIVYDVGRDETFTRPKGFMFPFGEYVPYILQPIIGLLVGSEKLTSYQSLREYSSGSEPYSFQTRIGKIGVLICSELTSSTAVHSLKVSDPDIVIVQASLTWTHNNPYYMVNHILSLKILATTLRKPIISVANTGPVVMVNAAGDVVSYIPSSFTSSLYMMQNNTFKHIQ